jgi:hypothetical protein
MKDVDVVCRPSVLDTVVVLTAATVVVRGRVDMSSTHRRIACCRGNHGVCV